MFNLLHFPAFHPRNSERGAELKYPSCVKGDNRMTKWIAETSKQYIVTAGLIFSCLSFSGCALLLLGAGAGAGVAGTTYVMGKLEDQVEAPVSKVQRASVAALKSLDLPVDKERGDKLAAEIESEMADKKKIWISIHSLTPSRSQITIRVGLLGDEARSRRILGAIRTRL